MHFRFAVVIACCMFSNDDTMCERNVIVFSLSNKNPLFPSFCSYNDNEIVSLVCSMRCVCIVCKKRPLCCV